MNCHGILVVTKEDITITARLEAALGTLPTKTEITATEDHLILTTKGNTITTTIQDMELLEDTETTSMTTRGLEVFLRPPGVIFIPRKVATPAITTIRHLMLQLRQLSMGGAGDIMTVGSHRQRLVHDAAQRIITNTIIRCSTEMMLKPTEVGLKKGKERDILPILMAPWIMREPIIILLRLIILVRTMAAQCHRCIKRCSRYHTRRQEGGCPWTRLRDQVAATAWTRVLVSAHPRTWMEMAKQ